MIYLKSFNESREFETDPNKIKAILEDQGCRYDIEPDGTINIENHFSFTLCLEKYKGRMPFKFGIVRGNFTCIDMDLTTLEGAPRIVGGIFHCGRNLLTDLRGAPEEVGAILCNMNNLTSFEGCPKIITDNPAVRGFNQVNPYQDYRGYFMFNNNPSLCDPRALRDIQTSSDLNVYLSDTPILYLWAIFRDDPSGYFLLSQERNAKMFPKFQESLDYNYFKYVDGKPCIIKWKFEEALQEILGRGVPDKIKGYKYID